MKSFFESWRVESPLWAWVSEHETWLAWLGGLSLIALVVSAAAVPMFIRRIPEDYFLDDSPGIEEIRAQHPVLRIAFLVVKNLLGGILLVGGIIMLFTPGQGVLTILIGLMLMNFPGKRRLEIRLIRIKPLNRAIGWIRRRGGQKPLLLPDET